MISVYISGEKFEGTVSVTPDLSQFRIEQAAGRHCALTCVRCRDYERRTRAGITYRVGDAFSALDLTAIEALALLHKCPPEVTS